ncbi:Phosphohistidine phosphatase SixA [hydrothermal vent metagenome]|uniref:Phosphohistidine phosphatase SixA n=1 Tax=hydrothermal vent metagenome TaxID=652676 RepID=A0A3B1B5H2_9ZZZZ
MKKQLTLIRHAKSSWGDSSLPDYERDLNKRGQADALRMGKTLNEQGIKFDLILCSSALRARETLSRLNESLKLEDKVIQYTDELYCASVPTLFEIIHQLDSNKNNVAIVAHNPGLEDLAAQLTDDHEIFATCSIMQIAFNVDNWSRVDKRGGSQLQFLSPKTV